MRYREIIRPDDPDFFIHIGIDDQDLHDAEVIRALPASLSDLDLCVSTGRVVDFRVRPHLRVNRTRKTVPLIHPLNLKGGRVNWPLTGGKKPIFIEDCPQTRDVLVDNATYVLVKRFSAKEERRRLVAAVCNPSGLDAPRIGLENHLNYFHANGRGLPTLLARGLSAFLNSSLVDRYFRQFSGHTQVNATDLRKIRYPSRATLVALGRRIGATVGDQDHLDSLVSRSLEAGS